MCPARLQSLLYHVSQGRNGSFGLFSMKWTSSGPVRNINMVSSTRRARDNGGDCVECSNQRAGCVLRDFASASLGCLAPLLVFSVDPAEAASSYFPPSWRHLLFASTYSTLPSSSHCMLILATGNFRNTVIDFTATF